MPKAKKKKLPDDNDRILRSDNPQPKKAKESEASKKKLKKASKKKKKKMSRSSSLRSSSLSSSRSTKVSVPESERDSVKSSGITKKSQCDMCKLSYTTEKELLEHLVSLMHHTKMEDKELKPEHKCTLCSTTCTDMADYRLHIGTDKHQKKLSILRGDSDEKNKKTEKKSRTHFHHSDNPNFNNQMPPWGPGAQRMPSFYGQQKNKYFNRSDQQGMNRWNPGFKQNSKRDMYQYENVDNFEQRGEQRGRRWGHNGNRDRKCFIDNGDMQPGFYEPWGSGMYGNHHQVEEFMGHNETHIQPFGYPENGDNGRSMAGDFNENQFREMDFTSDSGHAHWDEQSLVQREQFLAGMDDSFQYNQPPHYWSQCEQSFEQRQKTKWENPHPRDRKRPRNGDDVQESLAKTSRSISQSSDENVPVRDAPLQQMPRVYPSTSKSVSASKPSDKMKANSIDDASDNILERAERLCKELREKREAAQIQRNRVLKQHDREFLNQKMNALVQKQQYYMKGHIRSSENAQEVENYDSGISSVSTQVSKGMDAMASSVSNKSSSGLATSLKSKSSDKTLDEIRKSIEKSVLDSSEKPQSKQKSTSVLRPKQRSLSGGDTGLTRHGEGKDSLWNSTGRPASRPVSKPGLTKDSLLKMVNAPRSRDERLQLAKMVQSREEHKTTPRANIQLEGLYDSAVDIGGDNQGLSMGLDTPTIKLEDLSEGVREQILALIGEDMSSQAFGQLEPEPQTKLPSGHQPKTRTPASKDIITLSDIEQETRKSKHKKSTPQRPVKDSDSSRPDKSSGVSSSKAKRKKKKSEDDSNTKTPSLNKNSYGASRIVSNHIGDGGNLRPTTPVKHLNSPQTVKPEKGKYSVDMTTYSDVEVLSCSSDIDQGETYSGSSHVKTRTEGTRSKSPVMSLGELYKESNSNIPATSTEQRILSKNESVAMTSPVDQGQPQLNRENVREMFPTIMNAPRALSEKSSYVSSEVAFPLSLKTSASQLPSSKQSPEDNPSTIPSPEKGSVSPSQLSPNDHPTLHLRLSPSVYLRNHSPSPVRDQVPPSIDSANASPTISSTFSLSSQRKSGDQGIKETSTKSNISATESCLSSGRERSDMTDDTISIASTTMKGDATTSQAMSQLLVLSEREGEVKQELMSMELRLSRLHQLLEQAVVQISKCTERRNQLHVEEQELSKKRLSLLRDAASSNLSARSDVSDTNSFNLKSGSTSQEHIFSTKLGSTPAAVPVTSSVTNLPATTDFQTSNSTVVSTALPAERGSRLSSSEQSPGTSLSKADWLAKFASYLPSETIKEGNKGTGTRSYLQDANSELKKSQQSSSFNSVNEFVKLPYHEPVPEKNSKASEKAMDVEMSNSGSSNYPLSNLNPNVEKPAALGSLLNFKSSGDITGQSAAKELEMTSSTSTKSMVTATSTASTTTTVTTNIISLPIMYVGSFRSPTPVRDSSYDSQLNKTSLTSLLSKPAANSFSQLQHSGSNEVTSEVTHFDSTPNIAHDANFAAPDSVALPKPMRLYSSNHCGGDDSDIGSIASSVASGSSLGEQISRYCKSTPGASLDTAQSKHELSTILSDTSERRGFDSQLEEEEDEMSSVYVKKEDWDSSVKPCSVSLERIDYLPRKGIYGNLNKEAVRSAEALHLMERNFDATSFASSLNSEVGKKKKRKTKQERNISRLTHHRRLWVLSSSSDEEKEKEETTEELNISAVTSREKRNGLLSSNDEDSSACEVPMRDRLDRLTPKPDVLKTEFQSPSKSDVTIAECDSSTNLGIVDSESITKRTNTLKEMRASFERILGRPDFTSSETYIDINSTTDGPLSDKSKEFKHNLDSSQKHSILDDENKHMKMRDDNIYNGDVEVYKDIKQAENIIDFNKFSISANSEGLPPLVRPRSGSLSAMSSTNSSTLVSKPFFSSRLQVSNENMIENDGKKSHFPGDLGPVYDIQVVKEQLYIGHRGSCVCVYDLHGSYQESPVSKYPFPGLQCMTVVILKDVLTVVVGNGETLIFFDPNKTDCVSFELGTKIKCVLLVSPVVYVGLQSGEIHSVEIMKMKEKDRFLCSDYPIHCMAPAQEGGMKLLCASVEDGTIIVLNAQQCLPIRILTGHSKTAFSLQVEGQFIYSGSGDSTVQIQNVHTATVDHVFNDNKGTVMSVCWYQGYLFTGGMDKLVRCYDTKTNQLVQVFYGAERGVITKILVHNNMLITGNLQGSVDILELQLDVQHKCHKKSCGLNFGNRSHLFWHLLEDHNITAIS